MLTVPRLKREMLPVLSEQTGVHIVAGTAFYVDALMSEDIKKMTVEEVCVHVVYYSMAGLFIHIFA